MGAADSSIVAICKRLIAIPSAGPEGTRRIAEFCAAEMLAPNGIEARIIPSSHEGLDQVTLVAFIAGRNRDATPLVLNTHLDTVPAGDPALWTECDGKPHVATVHNDRIYGLGAADTKLDFVAKVTALAQCGRPNRDVLLVGTFGEEHGLLGAKEFAASGMLPRNAIAMVGEPSHLQLITAHKGLMAFELAIGFIPTRVPDEIEVRRVFHSGKAAHSSTPALGDNAIAKAIAAIDGRTNVQVVSINGGDAVNKVPAQCEVILAADSADVLTNSSREIIGRATHVIPAQTITTTSRFIRSLDQFARASGPAEEDYAAPTLTSNVGVISTRDDSIVLQFELRPPPSLALDVVREGVDRIVRELPSSADNLQLKLTERRANPGFRSPNGSEAVELGMATLARVQLPLETGVKAGCTEAGVYAAAGLQPIVFGPGPSTGVIHAPNEYNLLSEVMAAVRFYRALLE
jgi:acetylornithine deacetylase/succinyl-diaminopimelate desuccinylase-like protein